MRRENPLFKFPATIVLHAHGKECARITIGADELPQGSMRVGPNTDAVVWKVCDTNETVEL